MGPKATSGENPADPVQARPYPADPNHYLAHLIEEEFDIEDGMRMFEVVDGDTSLAPVIAQMHGEISLITLDFAIYVAEALKGGDRAGELLPLPPNSYHRGYCLLSHIQSCKPFMEHMLTDVARVLTPGGRFRFAVWDRDELGTAAENEAAYRLPEVFELIDRVGFEVVSMRRFSPDNAARHADEGPQMLFDVRPRAN